MYSVVSDSKHLSGFDAIIGNESALIQLAQCWFPALAISNDKI